MELTIEQIQDFETEMLKEVSAICARHKIEYYLAYGSVLGAIRHKGPIPWDTDSDIIVPINQFSKFVEVLERELSDRFYLDYYSNHSYSFLFPRIGLKGYSSALLHLDIFKLIGAPSGAEDQKEFKGKLDKYSDLFLYKKKSLSYLAGNSWKAKIVVGIKKVGLFFKSNEKLIQEFDQLCNAYPIDNSSYVINAVGGYGLKEFTPKSFYGKGIVKNYQNLQIQIPEKHDEYLKHFYGEYMEFPPEKEREIMEFYKITKT